MHRGQYTIVVHLYTFSFFQEAVDSCVYVYICHIHGSAHPLWNGDFTEMRANTLKENSRKLKKKTGRKENGEKKKRKNHFFLRVMLGQLGRKTIFLVTLFFFLLLNSHIYAQDTNRSRPEIKKGVEQKEKKKRPLSWNTLFLNIFLLFSRRVGA